MLVHQLGGAEPIDRAVEVFRHSFREIRQFHSSTERVYGKAVVRQRVVAVPDEGILRFLERRFDPVSYTHLDVYKRQVSMIPQHKGQLFPQFLAEPIELRDGNHAVRQQAQ